MSLCTLLLMRNYDIVSKAYNSILL